MPVPQSGGEDSDLEAFVRRCLSCDEGDQYAEAHRRLDRVLLARVLEAAGGDQHDAAHRLGISRESLERRLRELGLHPSRGLRGKTRENKRFMPRRSLADIEWEHIQRVVVGDQREPEEAAKILGIGEATLYRRLRERQNEHMWQLTPTQAAAPTGEAVTLADAEREHILGALRETGWVVGGPKGAAARLGMKRSLLYWKMKNLGISRSE